MPSHKRRAESILPTRAPKQPRITYSGVSGDGPSASQREGTLARWLSNAGKLALDFGREVRDAIFKDVQTPNQLSLSHSMPSHPSPPRPTKSPLKSALVSKSEPLVGRDTDSTAPEHRGPSRSTSPKKLARDNARPHREGTVVVFSEPCATPDKRSTRQESPRRRHHPHHEPVASSSTPKAGPSKPTHRETPSRGIPSRSPLPEDFRTRPSDSSLPPLPTTPKNGLQRTNVHDSAYYRSMAPPPSPHIPTLPTPRPSKSLSYGGSSGAPSLKASASASSSREAIPLLPWPSQSEIQATRAQVERRRKGSSVRTKAKPQREHIFAKVHEARVRDARKQDRIAMQKALYEAKKARGYSSDFRTFKSYLSYRELLESQDTLSTSRSLTNLRAAAQGDVPDNRRHSYGDAPSDVFFERALKIARDTLNSPKPPKPFVPTAQQRLIKEKNDEIERRLHGPKPLPEALPPADDAEVDDLLAKRGVISRVAREQVTDRDVSRLKPCQWLNDEIINFYGQMILSRSEECVSKKGSDGVNGVNGVNGIKSGLKKRGPKSTVLDVHYFSTFFWPKLLGDGYEKGRLAKWTKKFDIFTKDVILIPANHNNAHWTAAAINFRRKRFESYDSMGMARSVVFKALRQYVDLEHRNKKKKPFDFTGWIDYAPDDTPQQENGFDCGVFTCQFLESTSRGQEVFNFSQHNMSYLRRRMIWEIGHGRLRSDS